MEKNNKYTYSSRMARRRAIRRRNTFVAICILVLVLLFSLVGYLISSLAFKVDKNDNSSVTSGTVSKIESSIEEETSSKEESSSKKETSLKEESSSKKETSSKEESSSKKETSSKEESSSKKETSSKAETTSSKKPAKKEDKKSKLDPTYSRLLLVNGENPLPKNFDYTGNLMVIEDKYLCGWRNQLDKDVMPYVEAMIEAAWDDGVELYILSPYRSYDTQVGLFNAEVKKWKNKGMGQKEAEEKASTVVARPGTSEHHTGLAIDFNSVEDSFENTKMYKWLDKNAQDYGFILRYTEEKQSITGVIHESWHWRFVGINEAKKIKASGLCLEEYLGQ